jgi:hypothetical protein
MNDGMVKRAVRQGIQSRTVENGHGGSRKRKNAFEFQPDEMAEALRRAKAKRAKDEKAYAARKGMS